MQIRVQDFNGADVVVAGTYQQQWLELEQVLTAMPLHLKASDQAGKQGSPIFDPVGTNEYIAGGLQNLNWGAKIPIPAPFEFLGTDVDFGKNGVVIEAQFSNYPFLLNNTLRSDLFHRTQTVFHGQPTGLIVMVTKAHMFPSSNSTLYYEQALNQLAAMAQQNAYSVPLRLVGLMEAIGPIQAVWTEYTAARYSRTVATRAMRSFDIANGRGAICKVNPI